MKKIISIIIILLIVSVNGIYIMTQYAVEIYTDKCDSARNDSVKTYQNLKFAKRSVATLSGWYDTPDFTNLEIQNVHSEQGSIIYQIAGADRVYINIYSKQGTFASVDNYNSDRYILGFSSYLNYPDSYKTYFRKQTSEIFLLTKTQTYQYRIDPITLDKQFVPYKGPLDSLEYYGINVEVSQNGKEYERLPIKEPYITPFSSNLIDNACYYEEYDIPIPKYAQYIKVSINQSIKIYSQTGVSNSFPEGINLAKVEFVGNNLVLGNAHTENSSSSSFSSSSSSTSSSSLSSSINAIMPFSQSVSQSQSIISKPSISNVQENEKPKEDYNVIDDNESVQLQSSSTAYATVLDDAENIAMEDTSLQTLKLNYIKKDRRKSYILNTYNTIMMVLLMLTLTIESLVITQFKK